MDLTQTIIPKSDQLNADDLIRGPVTVTVESVSAGAAEQPVDIHLVEYPGRAYRPSKSMRRVLVTAWGPETSEYTGRRLTLYRNPNTKFGGVVVGGIEISHLSHIDKRLPVLLTVTRGKRAPHVVEPLPDVAPTHAEPTAEQVAATTDIEALRAMHAASTSPRVRALILARRDELNATPALDPSAPDPDDPDPTLGADWPTVTQDGERR